MDSPACLLNSRGTSCNQIYRDSVCDYCKVNKRKRKRHAAGNNGINGVMSLSLDNKAYTSTKTTTK